MPSVDYLLEKQADTKPILDVLKDTLGKDRTLYTSLAAAGAGGLLGGLTSAGTDDPTESPSKRRMRILKNTLMSTALGGGAGLAANLGADMLGTTEAFRAPGKDLGTMAAANYWAPTAAGTGFLGMGLHGLGTYKGPTAAMGNEALEKLHGSFTSRVGDKISELNKALEATKDPAAIKAIRAELENAKTLVGTSKSSISDYLRSGKTDNGAFRSMFHEVAPKETLKHLVESGIDVPNVIRRGGEVPTGWLGRQWDKGVDATRGFGKGRAGHALGRGALGAGIGLAADYGINSILGLGGNDKFITR